VGGTPGLVAAMFPAENLLLAMAAAAVGLVAGRLAAPLLTSPGAALVGTPGAPSLNLLTVAAVVGVALAVALAATLVRNPCRAPAPSPRWPTRLALRSAGAH
jgi:putative ABC transport system permease protein